MADNQEYKHKVVLLVDDSEVDNFINERMIVTSMFSRKVVVKTSCDEALAYLKSISPSDQDFPTVIFLDLNMPDKNGFDFLAEYDQFDDSVKNAMRVVVLSSSISPEDINKASSNPHVAKYINKPLSEKYLEAIHF
ncbi:MAG TPA: response regulator [Bacteroidia bacterium]|nr:response regulator [Bacteroidia bacterium]HNT79039.1 response regulator [Bacteroidia bacterium]